MDKLLYRDETFKIQGAVFEVYREMGCGFLEAVYQECLEKELRISGVPFESQKRLCVSYKGQDLEQSYKPDLICFDKIIVEVKAVNSLLPEHMAQVFNYLKASGLRLGMLANFGHYPKAEVQRIVL
jgi:GxxExxY protein